MARQCATCGKGPKSAALRSHAMNKVLTVQKPNLQKDEKGRLVCSRCRRTAAKKMK